VEDTAGGSGGGASTGDWKSVWLALSSFRTGLAFPSSPSHSLSVSAWTPRCTRAGRSVWVASPLSPLNLGDVYLQIRRSSADRRTRGGRVSTAGGRSSGMSFHAGGSGLTANILLLASVFLIGVRKTIQKRLSHKRKLVSAGRGADLRSRRALYLVSVCILLRRNSSSGRPPVVVAGNVYHVQRAWLPRARGRELTRARGSAAVWWLPFGRRRLVSGGLPFGRRPRICGECELPQ
jgi:hypothetical protein